MWLWRTYMVIGVVCDLDVMDDDFPFLPWVVLPLFLFNNYITYWEKEILLKYLANFIQSYGEAVIILQHHFINSQTFNLPQPPSWGFGVFMIDLEYREC